MWRSLTVLWLFKCSLPGHQTLSKTTATASSCLTFLDDFRVFDGWILFGTFISQTAWRPGQEANGATVNVVRCYLWHHYLPPEKQIKSFACLWRCNSLWHGLILWLERKTESLKHMDCIPYSGVGIFRTWYWESESVTRGIWKDWAVCCVHAWNEEYDYNSECSKAVLPTMQSRQHIYLHRAPR